MTDATAPNSESITLVPIAEDDFKEAAPLVRPLTQEEGFARLAMRNTRARVGPDAEGLEQKRLRELKEADVVDAARRSQTEIRRHVDSYLKEHFETIVADVTNVVVERIHERMLKGIAAMQEHQAVTLDRIAADMRAQLRAFQRAAWKKPTAQARRAPKARRAQAKR